MRLAFVAREAADQRDRDRDAGRGRDEVVEGQPDHLREVAHRRLADVRLPVGVGGEAHRRVERESAEIGPSPCGLNGRRCWTRCIR